MREGAPAGGARPAPHAHPANFEYDDNEWDIGIGDLIIDLDADIEKTDEAGGMAAREACQPASLSLRLTSRLSAVSQEPVSRLGSRSATSCAFCCALSGTEGVCTAMA